MCNWLMTFSQYRSKSQQQLSQAPYVKLFYTDGFRLFHHLSELVLRCTCQLMRLPKGQSATFTTQITNLKSLKSLFSCTCELLSGNVMEILLIT